MLASGTTIDLAFFLGSFGADLGSLGGREVDAASEFADNFEPGADVGEPTSSLSNAAIQWD